MFGKVVPSTIDMYIEKWCSDLFYSTRFLNYEVNLSKFTLFEMVNIIVQETSQIR